MRHPLRGLVLLTACALCSSAYAEEGMWTFDNFPAATVKQSFGAEITSAWLDHVRLSTLRLTNCSASFVSPDGLILTNHHCVEACLAELSSPEKSLLQLGFLASPRKEEQRCAAQHADVLMSTENITEAVRRAESGLGDVAANDARKKLLTSLEQACAQASEKSRTGRLECQSVRLYQGGQYFLYKYKRYTDLRLVFAPEADIASFGGDPDNFQFPRWSLDFSLLRAYENDKPAKSASYLQIDFAGPQAEQLVFVAGEPGTTARLQTRSQLEFDRDVSLPNTLLRASELRGRYIQFGKINAGDERIALAPLNNLQNAIKVRRGELDALLNDDLLDSKSRSEQALRAQSPIKGTDPWNDIAAATARERGIYLPYVFIEVGVGFSSGLFHDARLLLRSAEERLKPNKERLREYTDSELPRMQRDLFASIPVYAEFEQLNFSFSLERMREWLGPDNLVVRKLMSRESPDALATRIIAETQLNNAAYRKHLWDGGKAALDASHDPMIELARAVDSDARATRRRYEDEVEAPISVASQKIAAARFAVYGTNAYPDATFTLRLNYGTVQGWRENGIAVQPFTHLDRAFERATGSTPFRIPDSWMRVKGQLAMNTPFCISTSNDIVGGNSGSPLIDSSGKIVGLIFDGNSHSLAGRYWFEPDNNRAIALHPAIMLEALSKVYQATELLKELRSN